MSRIYVRCPHCRLIFELGVDQAGQEINCPKCQWSLVCPGQEPETLKDDAFFYDEKLGKPPDLRVPESQILSRSNFPQPVQKQKTKSRRLVFWICFAGICWFSGSFCCYLFQGRRRLRKLNLAR